MIGICYLASPIHREIGSILHGISHFLEAPDTLLDHRHEHKTHTYHEHAQERTDDAHDHLAINFIDSLFSAFDGDKNQKESVYKSPKLDKHLHSNRYTFPPLLLPPETTNFGAVENKLKEGYPKIPLEPPKHPNAFKMTSAPF
ncbi:hypothetical protein SAMN04488513_104117 [Pseudozobellia thermophila]|uniref:Uncharacterized protein n=1 Tax=Pseudozobellia thermophila TaxID=192903 RepID=A0A1M6ITX2_9FLAO|nr:hypothetical protein SAMN04488513_104117 [Pseudozobellia thermophila]